MTKQEYKEITLIVEMLRDIISVRYRSPMYSILSVLESEFNKKYSKRQVQLTLISGIKRKSIKGYCIRFGDIHFTTSKGYKRRYFDSNVVLL